MAEGVPLTSFRPATPPKPSSSTKPPKKTPKRSSSKKGSSSNSFSNVELKFIKRDGTKVFGPKSEKVAIPPGAIPPGQKAPKKTTKKVNRPPVIEEITATVITPRTKGLAGQQELNLIQRFGKGATERISDVQEKQKLSTIKRAGVFRPEVREFAKETLEQTKRGERVRDVLRPERRVPGLITLDPKRRKFDFGVDTVRESLLFKQKKPVDTRTSFEKVKVGSKGFVTGVPRGLVTGLGLSTLSTTTAVAASGSAVITGAGAAATKGLLFGGAVAGAASLEYANLKQKAALVRGGLSGLRKEQRRQTQFITSKVKAAGRFVSKNPFRTGVVLGEVSGAIVGSVATERARSAFELSKVKPGRTKTISELVTSGKDKGRIRTLSRQDIILDSKLQPVLQKGEFRTLKTDFGVTKTKGKIITRVGKGKGARVVKTKTDTTTLFNRQFSANIDSRIGRVRTETRETGLISRDVITGSPPKLERGLDIVESRLISGGKFPTITPKRTGILLKVGLTKGAKTKASFVSETRVGKPRTDFSSLRKVLKQKKGQIIGAESLIKPAAPGKVAPSISDIKPLTSVIGLGRTTTFQATKLLVDTSRRGLTTSAGLSGVLGGSKFIGEVDSKPRNIFDSASLSRVTSVSSSFPSVRTVSIAPPKVSDLTQPVTQTEPRNIDRVIEITSTPPSRPIVPRPFVTTPTTPINFKPFVPFIPRIGGGGSLNLPTFNILKKRTKFQRSLVANALGYKPPKKRKKKKVLTGLEIRI